MAKAKRLTAKSLYQKNKAGLFIGSFAVIAVVLALAKMTNISPSPRPSSVISPTPAPKDSSKTTATESAKPIVNNLPYTAGETFTYTVKEHDTLFSIGKVFCNSNAAWMELAERNNIYPPYTLHKGDTLEISCQ